MSYMIVSESMTQMYPFDPLHREVEGVVTHKAKRVFGFWYLYLLQPKLVQILTFRNHRTPPRILVAEIDKRGIELPSGSIIQLVHWRTPIG